MNTLEEIAEKVNDVEHWSTEGLVIGAAFGVVVVWYLGVLFLSL